MPLCLYAFMHLSLSAASDNATLLFLLLHIYAFRTFRPVGLYAFRPLSFSAFRPLRLYAFMHVGLYAFMPVSLYAFMHLGLHAFMHLSLYAFMHLSLSGASGNATLLLLLLHMCASLTLSISAFMPLGL